MTMRALVVFESAFGNTQKIARAVAEGISLHVPADTVEVGGAPTDLEGEIAILVVGGPTQAFSMSRSSTRQQAAKQAGPDMVSKGIGIREWLMRVKGIPPGTPAAAFDTRFKKPKWLTGSAGKAADKRLRELGCRMAAPAQSFFVDQTAGPLLEGELARAREWGERLGAVVEEPASRS
jgi:flavodoxin